MARGGINKALVQKAKAQLLAQGKRPSIDAVRVALGNTGSKTTISQYLKELDNTRERPATSLERLTGPLAQAVTSLAELLQTEADQVVAQVRNDSDACQTQLSQRLHDAQVNTEGLAKQNRILESQLREQNQYLQQQAAKLRNAQMQLTEAHAKVQEQGTQLTEKQSQITELIIQSRHARDGLEHFRQQSQDARDALLHGHEQQIQHYTGQLRTQSRVLDEQQQALIDLNRDNARLIEDLTRVKQENARLEKTLRGTNQRCEHLSSHHAQLLGQKELIAEQFVSLQQQLDAKHDECERLKTARSTL